MNESPRRNRGARRSRRDKGSARTRREEPDTPGHGPLIRSLLIIAFLIVAIAITWKTYRRRLATMEEERSSKPELAIIPPEIIASPEAPPEVPAIPLADLAETPEIPALPPSPPPEAIVTPAEAEPRSPAQSLIRLRDALASGRREEMPAGTIRRGTSDFFLVSAPMTWQQANGFAAAYGGHLPISPFQDDLQWLAAQLADASPADPARSSLWLGTRQLEGKWHALDGSPWSPEIEGDGTFAAISSDGTLHARGESERHPFFIQWQLDGSNPTSLRSVLARTKASLAGPEPTFPPGTVIDGDRHLLLVLRAINATDARELAETAGAQLMVPATVAEADWIAREAATSSAPDGLWLGATRIGAEWKWDSGEPWTFARWDPASPPGEGSALRIVPGKGWQAADPAAEASGFVIEWGSPVATADENANPDGQGILLEKTRELLVALVAERNEELEANAKNLTWSLDIWLRTNNKSDIARWKPRVQDLKERVRNHRVPTDLPKRPDRDYSERMLKIARDCLAKQKSIDADFRAKASRIRDAYVDRLLEQVAAEEQRGQPALARQLSATAEAAADLDAWFASLGPLSAK